MLRGITAVAGVSVWGQLRGVAGLPRQAGDFSRNGLENLESERRGLEAGIVSTISPVEMTTVTPSEELGWETILSYGGAAAGGVAFVVTVGRWVKGKIDEKKKKAQIAAELLKDEAQREIESETKETKAYEEAKRQEAETVVNRNEAVLELSMGPEIQLVVTKESLMVLLEKARRQEEASEDLKRGTDGESIGLRKQEEI